MHESRSKIPISSESLPESTIRYYIILMVALSGLFGCSRASHNPDLDATVASWNEIGIDGEHFVQEYQLFGTYAPFKDEPEIREYYAKVMLERQIIAEIGRRNSLDTLKIVQETIKRRKEMAMRRHYLNTMVKPSVAEPTEPEIYMAFRRANARLRTQQIFAPTRDEIFEHLGALQNGTNFDEVAERSMVRAGVAPGSAGYMGWVTFDELDEEPEEVLFATARNAYSRPVESLKGWHIFRVLDEEETVHFDQSTYHNQRDRLRHRVYQRRYNEASARFIRNIVMEHELAIDMRVLREVYQQLLPSLPKQNRPEEIIRFNNELNFLDPVIDNSTPVAMVNGQPFTVGQFFYQMPDIPVEWMVSDFRHALEIAIRDSILAAKSVAARPDTSRDVRLNERIAEYTALYYATMQAAVDTMQIEPLKPDYYHHWKDAHFVDFRTTTYYEYNFADSATATNAVLTFKENQDWQKTLASLPEGSFTFTEHVGTTKEAINVPIHSLPVNDPDSPATIVGPYKRANWSIFKAINRETTHKPFETVEEDVLKLLHERRIYVVHRELLPDDYDPNDVILKKEILDRLIPYYF